MRDIHRALSALAAAIALLGAGQAPAAAPADKGLHRLNHVIVIFQENRSFDHYFGVLPYVAGSPYHHAAVCDPGDLSMG